MSNEKVGQPDALFQPGTVKGGLGELKQAPRNEGIVVREPFDCRLSAAVSMQEAAVRGPHLARDKPRRGFRRGGESRLREGARRLRKCCDHQTIPVRQYLVVPQRPDTAGP